MWRPGDVIVRREVWRGRPYGAWGGHVVSDEDDLLVLYMPAGSPLEFAHDFFGAPHPWGRRKRWHGHGVLQLQRPAEMHSVWVFWDGPDRDFAAWYVNIQEPFRRTPIGVDTQDLELDIVVEPDGSWTVKDDDKLEAWVERGRYTEADVSAIRAEGARLIAELDAGRRWWSEDWASWEPDPEWQVPELPDGWDRVA